MIMVTRGEIEVVAVVAVASTRTEIGPVEAVEERETAVASREQQGAIVVASKAMARVKGATGSEETGAMAAMEEIALALTETTSQMVSIYPDLCQSQS